MPPSPVPPMPSITVTTNGIVKLISNLNPNKASGPDNVSICLLKMAPDDNASVLCFIFQQSLNSGCVPLDWKFALVNPVHKKGPCSDPGNYHPISLMCISCKLLEHVISSSIMKHLDQSNILSPFQHGFCLCHSCETQLLFTVHDLAKGIDQHLQTDFVLLDFTKAFDSVPH